MPIRFRCPACRKKLSISRRRAGAVVACPSCAEQVRVPERRGGEKTSSAPEQEPKTARQQPADEEVEPTAPVVESEDEEGGFELSRRRPDAEGLDMTPMVDVTFLLLIFFMITASFSLQKSMEAEPPEEEQEGFAQMPRMDELADESVIVEIDQSDAIFVDEEPVAGVGELEDVLRRKMTVDQKRELIIEAHYQARHGTVVAVHDAGIEVGMQRIRRVSSSEQ